MKSQKIGVVQIISSFDWFFCGLSSLFFYYLTGLIFKGWERVFNSSGTAALSVFIGNVLVIGACALVMRQGGGYDYDSDCYDSKWVPASFLMASVVTGVGFSFMYI